MALELTLGHYLNMGGGVVISLLGLFVVSKTRGVRGTNLFGWFLVSFGLIFITANLDDADGPIREAFAWATGVLCFLTAIVLAIAAPRMVSAKNLRRRLVLAWLVVLPVLTVVALLRVLHDESIATDFVTAGSGAWMSAFIVAMVLWAFEHRYEATATGHSRRWAALTVGLGLYPFVQVGEWIMELDATILGRPTAASMAVVVGFWLANTRPPGGRAARNVALLLLFALLVGMVMEAQGVATASGINGITRLLGVGIIVHAILRDRLLGIDAKVRFALSKSTVAAVFIAVFFIASEGAQQFFGDRLGGAYVGIAAAGMLVFAIAPLQRAAERLAEKAVPVVPVAAAGRASAPRDSREADYREAVRLALRDRILSRDEERHLIRVAHHMGIEPGRAMEIQDDLERTVKRGGR